MLDLQEAYEEEPIRDLGDNHEAATPREAPRVEEVCLGRNDHQNLPNFTPANLQKCSGEVRVSGVQMHT